MKPPMKEVKNRRRVTFYKTNKK